MSGRGAPTVAIAVGRASAPRDSDTPLLAEALEARSVAARVVAWDDPDGGWDAFDVVVVRSTWDYVSRLEEFLTWAESVPRLVNPADVLRWNTDKSYLRDLERSGIPVVPTAWFSPGQPLDPPEHDFVVKPSVGNGARGSARYRAGDRSAVAHVERLHAEGVSAIVQPFLSSIEHRPETGVVVIGGQASHAIAKPLQLGRVLRDDSEEDRGITRTDAVREELAVAERAIDAVPGGSARILYARVDMVRDDAGRLAVMELELTEPALFLALEPGSADRLAAAVVALLDEQ